MCVYLSVSFTAAATYFFPFFFFWEMFSFHFSSLYLFLIDIIIIIIIIIIVIICLDLSSINLCLKRSTKKRKGKNHKGLLGKANSIRLLGPNAAVCCCYHPLWSRSQSHRTARVKAPPLTPLPPAEDGMKRKNATSYYKNYKGVLRDGRKNMHED